MAKNKNTSIFTEPKEYVITSAMKELIHALKTCGYQVEVVSQGFYCTDFRKGFSFYRYCTEISIDEYDGEGNAYTFDFTPDGERIFDYDFDPKYCIKT